VAIREIVLMGDPVLRRPADLVEGFDDGLRRLVADMFETMYHAEGVGLAAPQIGISRRILVVDVREREDGGGRPIALINPEVVTESEETERSSEGCLSIPGLEEVVQRPSEVEVRGFDEHGKDMRFVADDLFGRALQHEIDHLNGILFVDRITPLKRRILLKKWRKILVDEEKKEARR
jgi:peptide deformylase